MFNAVGGPDSFIVFPIPELARYDLPMRRKPRRRVDWVLIEGADAARAHLDSPSGEATGVAHITSALFSDSSAQAIETVLRNTVEFARRSIGLERVAIYLVAPGGRSMVGAWGTDMAGRTTDEHELMYDMNDLLRKFFARSARGYPWSVYQDCPLVTHDGGKSRTVGQGWNAYTIIQGSGSPLGIMFNDTAISRAPFDEGKEAQAALLCALLGHALAPCLATNQDIADVSSCSCNTPEIAEENKDPGVSRTAGRHASQDSSLLDFMRASLSRARPTARSTGTWSPRPKYISSGVWPAKAEWGTTELCCSI